MVDNVVVLGGGLAGVAAAHRLGDEGIAVTLVDRNDYHQFQPLLYQVATSQLPAEDIARPYRTVFRNYPSVEVLTTEVSGVDLSERVLRLSDGSTVRGSHLVMASGARANFFGVPGAAEHAFPLYSVADAERLRRHLRRLLVAPATGPDQGDASSDVVVVGGGATGVEIAGALAELMGALHATGQIAEPGRITIVDRGSALLGAFTKKSRRYALKKVTEAGVTPRLGVGVAAVHADRVELDDGSTVKARTVVWGGGESGSAIAQNAGPKAGRGGRLDVLPDLTIDGYPGVYAVGDVANIPAGDGAAFPQLGSVAQQSGRWAAENILRELHGKGAEPFRYKDKGIMAMIGRNAAVAEVGKRRHQVEGPIAFAAWLGVHAMLLSGAHSKTDAFLSWAWDFVGTTRSNASLVDPDQARIDWGPDPDDQSGSTPEGDPT